MDPNFPHSDDFTGDWGDYSSYYQPGLDQINLNEEAFDAGSAEPQTTPQPTAPKGKKRAAKGKKKAAAAAADEEEEEEGKKRHSWTVAETDVLVRIWMEETNDAILGADQKADQYWGRVLDRFNAMMPEQFSKKQLKSHWGRLSHETKVWEQCWVEGHARWPSGHSDDMMAAKVEGLFKPRNRGVPFKWKSAWEILRKNHRFRSNYLTGDVHSSKRAKTSEEGSFTTSASPGEESISTRPQGNKAAKAAAKGKGKKQAAAPFDEMMNFLDETRQNLAALTEAKQEKLRLKREAMDMKILYMDTSNMTTEQLAIHQFNVNEVLQRRGYQ